MTRTFKVRIIKGNPSFAIGRCEVTLTFTYVDKLGMRCSPIGNQTLWLAGRRLKMEVGKEYNLHNGDPTRKVRILLIEELSSDCAKA